MRAAGLCVLLLLTNCTTTGRPHEQRSASEALAAAVEAWFEEDLRLNPIRATYLGDHRFDDQLGDPASEAHEAQTRAAWQRALAQVQAIDPGALSQADQLTLEVFVYNAQLALEGLEFPRRLLPLSQMDSLVLDLARLGSGQGPQPFVTADDHHRWLRRAGAFPTWVDSAVAAMRDGQAQGITLPRVTMEKVVAQLDTLAVEQLEQSVFFAPLQALDGAERTQLEPEYRRVFEGRVLPALFRLRDFVRDEHLPACRQSVGWSSLPDGERWYAWHAKASTTTALTPEEIHALGLAEVARILRGMDEVRTKVRFEGALPEFFTWARENPAFYFTDPGELIAGYLQLKAQIDRELPKLFSVFPRADYEVRPVEAFRAESAPGAEYQAPSADGTRPGIFYVNTFNLKAQPKYGMQTLSLHEAAPGHHFQIALQQELELPRFRRFGGYTAYVEGWALYAETLGPQLGLYEEPMDYYGHLSDAQLRAMRLVVDTGLHVLGWSREQAIEYMLDNSSMARSDVTAEVERYMVWPGQALGYKVGELRISAMRALVAKTLGARFDLKAFHAAVLTDGSLPMAVLERKLQRFVAERQ
jgi:uncharacterized protein (DUF885 family)